MLCYVMVMMRNSVCQSFSHSVSRSNTCAFSFEQLVDHNCSADGSGKSKQHHSASAYVLFMNLHTHLGAVLQHSHIRTCICIRICIYFLSSAGMFI